MDHPIRTIDLAAVAAPSEYIGRRAVWTDVEGRQHVGVLAPDPFGGPWPIVDFGDGTHGRNGSVVDLVDDEPQFSELWYSTPCRDTFTPDPSTAYTCSRARHDDGNHDWVRLDFWTTVQRHDRADPR